MNAATQGGHINEEGKAAYVHKACKAEDTGSLLSMLEEQFLEGIHDR